MAEAIGKSIEELEMEMIEKVRERVDPALGDTWRTFRIYLNAYIGQQNLQECEDFSQVFDLLEKNGQIIRGCYDTLIYILRNSDAPSANAVETFQKEIFSKLSNEEKNEIESWKSKKSAKAGSIKNKSAQDLEAEMINCINARVGPAMKREWQTFKLRLKPYLSKAEIELCSDVDVAFQKLKLKGKIKLGDYSALIKILENFDVPSKDDVESYSGLIQLRFKESEQEIRKEVAEHIPDNGAKKQKRDENETSSNLKVALTAKFRKSNDDTQRALVSDMRSKCNKSVGYIVSPKCTGTGFRVGTKYIMTCWHVVDGMMKDESLTSSTTNKEALLERPSVYIQFEYKRPNQQFQPENQFGFVGRIPYYNPLLDVAILELKNEGHAFPPPITNFARPNSVDEIHFIGHPNSQPMREDPGIKIFQRTAETEEDIKKMNEWCLQRWNTNDYLALLDPNKILFDCAFQFGASGSPGMIVADDKDDPVVVIMLQGGVPKYYLELNDDQKRAEQIPNSYLKEFGIGMHTVFLDMSNNSQLEGLRKDIFKL